MAEEKDTINYKKYKPALSVVVPVYNERENIPLLYGAIKQVCERLQKPYEMVFVDDGSNDGSRSVLKELAAGDSRLCVVFLRRNFGQSAAMAAGFQKSRGEVVVAMDGDLQNDPEDIPGLLKKIDEGYDVVSGWRKNRKDKLFIRKIPSRIANLLITSVTDVRLHDTGCSLKAFRRNVINQIRVYGELHRFIPALARIEGARIAEIVVNHHPRKYGRSKYNLTRTFRVLMDLCSLNLFIKYLRNPFQFFGQIGFAVFGFSLLSTFWMVYRVVIQRASFPDFNVILTLIFLMWISGFQFFFFGLVASLIVHTGKKHGATLAFYQWFHKK